MQRSKLYAKQGCHFIKENGFPPKERGIPLALWHELAWVCAREGVLGLIFAGYVLLTSHSPYSIIVHILWPILDLILVIFGQCNFCNPTVS